MLRKIVWQDTHTWAAKGHKANREIMRRMMLVFADHAEFSGARNPGQVGPITVIKFWKFLRIKKKLSWNTQMNYWRAILNLWQLWGKPGEPPRPRNPERNKIKADNHSTKHIKQEPDSSKSDGNNNQPILTSNTASY